MLRRVLTLNLTHVSEVHSATIRAMVQTVRTSETSVSFKETLRRYIPEDCQLHTCRRENLKSHRAINCFHGAAKLNSH
jgi:sugar diacid utilization regulator